MQAKGQRDLAQDQPAWDTKDPEQGRLRCEWDKDTEKSYGGGSRDEAWLILLLVSARYDMYEVHADIREETKRNEAA